MSITLAARDSSATPVPVTPVIVRMKWAWGDDWTVVPEARLMEATRHTGGQDVDQAVIEHRYGMIRHPWQSEYKTYLAVNTAGAWVRVDGLTPKSSWPIWIGRCGGDASDLLGSEPMASGVQRIVCYGPQMLLQKFAHSYSYWINGSESPQPTMIGWIPGMNANLGDDFVSGNRSSDKVQIAANRYCYLYGGASQWSRQDYAEYLLTAIMQGDGEDVPRWRLTGQKELLADIKDVIAWPTTFTVGEALRRLIDPALGMDYLIEPASDDKGFDVRVFALSSQRWSWGGMSVEANPNTLRVPSGSTPHNLATRVVRSAEHMHGRVRVLGKRMIVCFSLEASKGTLVPKWSAALETEYKAGKGAVVAGDMEMTAEQADIARQNARYRDVFTYWGLPYGWGLTNVGGAPLLKSDGTIAADEFDTAPCQSTVRRTLEWTPLRARADYSQGWPPQEPTADDSPDDTPTAEFLPAAAWVSFADWGYYPVENLDIGLSVPDMEWGIHLVAQPNHVLAVGDWASNLLTDTPPQYSAAASLVATIAVESDQRLALTFTAPGATAADGVEEIEVEDAELWVLAPHTVVGVRGEVTGKLVRSPSIHTEIRNDFARLRKVMAGAIARYYGRRNRAEIVGAGMLPWGKFLGAILTVVESGGGVRDIEAPITTIEWQSDPRRPRTILRTGFAQG
jgi:hypothetical protein